MVIQNSSNSALGVAAMPHTQSIGVTSRSNFEIISQPLARIFSTSVMDLRNLRGGVALGLEASESPTWDDEISEILDSSGRFSTNWGDQSRLNREDYT